MWHSWFERILTLESSVLKTMILYQYCKKNDDTDGFYCYSVVVGIHVLLLWLSFSLYVKMLWDWLRHRYNFSVMVETGTKFGKYSAVERAWYLCSMYGEIRSVLLLAVIAITTVVSKQAIYIGILLNWRLKNEVTPATIDDVGVRKRQNWILRPTKVRNNKWKIIN